MEKEIKKIGNQLTKIMKEYQKCSANICIDEKIALMKDTNKKAPKMDIKILLDKDQNKKELYLKELSEYPLNFNHFKCNYNKCGKIIKKLLKFIISITIKKKSLMKVKLTETEDKYFKELDILLKKQKLTDDELKQISFSFLKSSF